MLDDRLDARLVEDLVVGRRQHRDRDARHVVEGHVDHVLVQRERAAVLFRALPQLGEAPPARRIADEDGSSRDAQIVHVALLVGMEEHADVGGHAVEEGERFSHHRVRVEIEDILVRELLEAEVDEHGLEPRRLFPGRQPLVALEEMADAVRFERTLERRDLRQVVRGIEGARDVGLPAAEPGILLRQLRERLAGRVGCLPVVAVVGAPALSCIPIPSSNRRSSERDGSAAASA